MGKRENLRISYSALCEYPGTDEPFNATVRSRHSPAYWPGDLVDSFDSDGNPVRALILGVMFAEVVPGEPI